MNDIGAALRRASPQGRLNYLRQRIMSGELRHGCDAIEAEAAKLQAMLDSGNVAAPAKFMLRLARVERGYPTSILIGPPAPA